MEIRNSTGRKVSLLNDSSDSSVANHPFNNTHHARHVITRLPSVNASLNSPCPSSASSLSPQTPPLVRSESSDSRQFASPSPLTPQSGSFDTHQPPQKQAAHPHQQSYYLYRQSSWSHKMDDPTLYPAIPEAATLTGYPLPSMQDGMTQPRVRASDSPVSDSHFSNVSATSAASKPNKKNQYPCPLAKQYKCNDFFTTSGHAARHAKKHTGRKDAICPECNKAFTRKDNMEQHRRTHQNVRGPSKNSENRVKKPSKLSSRKNEKQINNAPLEAAVAQLEDQQAQVQMLQPNAFALPTDQTIQPSLLPGSGPYFMNADPVAALPQPMSTDFSGRPQLYRSNYTNALDFTTTTLPPSLQDPELHFNYPSPGLSNGLNTLALAASGHRRMPEDARRSSEESTSTNSDDSKSEGSSTP